PLAPDPACQLRTIRALADEAFDVLHLHEPLAPGPTMTALVMHPAPTVGTFHAAGDSTSYRMANRSLNWLAGRLDLRVAVSDDARELAERYFGGTYDMLFNGVELDRYRSTPSVPRRGPTIMFCGRHEPRKGLDVLLGALADLPDDVRCWVASDGPDTDELRARFGADERIEWLGRLTDEEKIARLAAADVFCAPSLRGESFGVVLIEAMAAGTPIVASDLPGYRRVARPDVDALLTPPGDHAALATALKRVLEDDDLAATLSASGTVRAEEFSMRSLAQHYIERYQALLDVQRAGTRNGADGGRAGARVPRWVRRIMAPS
ncbi:MAG TPA: glycosyltransferase family 4 protein, partial [Acidimicrobiales bacterium]